jgi:hypothetical protein
MGGARVGDPSRASYAEDPALGREVDRISLMGSNRPPLLSRTTLPGGPCPPPPAVRPELSLEPIIGSTFATRVATGPLSFGLHHFVDHCPKVFTRFVP